MRHINTATKHRKMLPKLLVLPRHAIPLQQSGNARRHGGNGVGMYAGARGSEALPGHVAVSSTSAACPGKTRSAICKSRPYVRGHHVSRSWTLSLSLRVTEMTPAVPLTSVVANQTRSRMCLLLLLVLRSGLLQTLASTSALPLLSTDSIRLPLHG